MKRTVRIYLKPVIKELEIDDSLEDDEERIEWEEDRLILDVHREEILSDAQIDYWEED